MTLNGDQFQGIEDRYKGVGHIRHAEPLSSFQGRASDEHGSADPAAMSRELRSRSDWDATKIDAIKSSLNAGDDIEQPLIINSKGSVADGHHRLAAAHELGRQSVPVFEEAHHLTSYSVSMNLRAASRRALMMGQGIDQRDVR